MSISVRTVEVTTPSTDVNEAIASTARVTASINANGTLKGVIIQPNVGAQRPINNFHILINQFDVEILDSGYLGRTANVFQMPIAVTNSTASFGSIGTTASANYPVAGPVEVIGYGIGTAHTITVQLLVDDD